MARTKGPDQAPKDIAWKKAQSETAP